MNSYTSLKTRSHTMKCGPSHTTTCMCHSEADAPWGRILMLTSTPNQPSSSTQNQLSSGRNWSHCQRTRALAEDSHEPATCLDDAGNEIPDMLTVTDDLPEVDMARPLRVTFGKKV